jgi:hypothetical protein
VITTGDFNEPARTGLTVYDLLVTNGPLVDTRSASINTFERGGQFPSDHLPLQAVVRLPAG